MVQSYSIKPSLDNAFIRVRRANQHLDGLKIERSKLTTRILGGAPMFQSVTIHPIQTDNEGITGTFIYNLHKEFMPFISILVSEAIYNLRAALDYLIYELAILDSGQIQDGTQFPIENSPRGWKFRRDGCPNKRNGIPDYGCYLRGISFSHKAIIKTLQPATVLWLPLDGHSPEHLQFRQTQDSRNHQWKASHNSQNPGW